MNYRNFGKTNLKVSEISLGCSRLGKSVFGTFSEKESIYLLQQAQEMGVNLFDTAPTYCYGDSERLIGRAFRHQRDKVIIATKTGRKLSKLATYGKTIRAVSGIIQPFIAPLKRGLKKRSSAQFDFSEQWLEKSLHQSLKRLQTEYIDVFLLHSPSLEVLKQGAVFEVLEKFKKAGKIRHYGVSIDTFEQAQTALQYSIDAMQINFNLIQNAMGQRLFEVENINQKVGIMIKIPFMRGVLTPKAQASTGHYYSNEEEEAIMNKRQTLSFLSKNRTWPQLALQYIFNHQEVSTALCGTTSLKHLKEHLSYTKAPAFTEEELEKIKEIEAKYSPFPI